jgi:hypothetical protein
MAKRVSPEEKPFNPVGEALTRSVLEPEAEEVPAPPPAPPRPKVVTIDGKKPDIPAAKEQDPPKASTEPVNPKKLKHVRRFLVTDEENFTLDQLATDIGRRLGTTIDVSHLLRATTTLLVNSSAELLKQSEKLSGLKRPSNNDAAGLVAFEHNLTRLVDRAIRNSKVLD